MDRWNLFSRTKLLWLCVIVLVGDFTTSTSAAGTEGPQPRRDEISSITVHVSIPVPALAELYAGIHRDLASHRTTAREWVALGGGTGFLKYRIWPGNQESKIGGGRLFSHATFPFGVEYAKRLNGSLTKVAECGQRDPTAGTGRLSVQLATTFAQGRG